MNSVGSVYLLHLLIIFNLFVKVLLFFTALILFFGYNFIHLIAIN